MTTTDATADKLIEMLKENTGKHFLDSGGHYGRNWERNQGIDFEKQPEGCIEFWQHNGELEIVPMLDVYHWLEERLDFNPELDKQYREYVESEGDGLHLLSAESFAESIDGKGIHGDNSGPITINTYNGEDLLSQIIQFVYWTDEGGDAHILLQIHGGCDTRGGYTDPVAFDVADFDGTGIFDNARASIYCNDCQKYWDTDDGCHWYADIDQDLNDYPATDKRPDYPNPNQLTLPISLPEQPTSDVGVIWVDDDHNGHCPHCGGILCIVPWPVG